MGMDRGRLQAAQQVIPAKKGCHGVMSQLARKIFKLATLYLTVARECLNYESAVAAKVTAYQGCVTYLIVWMFIVRASRAAIGCQPNIETLYNILTSSGYILILHVAYTLLTEGRRRVVRS